MEPTSNLVRVFQFVPSNSKYSTKHRSSLEYWVVIRRLFNWYFRFRYRLSSPPHLNRLDVPSCYRR